MTATIAIVDNQSKSHSEVLNLPNRHRGYEFKTIEGEVFTHKSLRTGLRQVLNIDDENIESVYQCVYTALFTRKKTHYIKNEVRIKVINYTDYIESLYN